MMRRLLNPCAALPPALLALLVVAAAAPMSVRAAATCSRPSRNTLTSECFGACGAPSLCVNYAAKPADDATRIGDGNYYYQGCAFASMRTCKASATCELQCLQTANAQQQAWVLDVAQPQKDKAETSLFLHVEDIVLPSTLKNLSIVGTTELTRKVPISFAAGVFQDSAVLGHINILDVAIENITSNIFPPSLQTLTIQRTKLQQFDPRGNQRFSELRVLDLRENALTEIPIIVYEMRGLTDLYLQGNAIRDAHVTAPQLAYLKALRTFKADLRLSTSAACQDGYKPYTWDATRTVCFSNDDMFGASVDMSRDGDTASTNNSSSSSSGSRTGVVLVVVAVAVFVVAAVVAGVFLLKRAKRKASEPSGLIARDAKRKAAAAASKLRAKFSASSSNVSVGSDLMDPLQSQRSHRANDAFRVIAAGQLHARTFVALNGAVRVSSAELQRKHVFVAELQDDAAQSNCELALDVVPVVSQLRHPQLLAVVGLVGRDVRDDLQQPPHQTVSIVFESMNQGTLEAFLLRSGRDLTWAGFKVRAALDIAGCLMYLHTKHRLSYGALTGKSVFVDDDKGCKLNTLVASIPDDAAVSLARCSDHDAETAAQRLFLAPEVLAGAPSRSSSDMFAFGVLLAQLDTCLSAADMLHRSSTHGRASALPFTAECPAVIQELASACVQLDPSLRPSASYVVAMLQQSC